MCCVTSQGAQGSGPSAADLKPELEPLGVNVVREAITDTSGRPHDREGYVQPEKRARVVTGPGQYYILSH